MMKKLFNIFTLLLTLFFVFAGCDNGSAPDSSNNLVKVSLTVEGDTSEVSQKSISITGNDLSNIIYKYNAVPQWSSPNIYGATDWTPINYSGETSLGYFSPGKWVFGVQILIGDIPIYQGFSEVNISNSSVRVNVPVELATQTVSASVRIAITAPTVNNEELTISYSGASSGGPITAAASPSEDYVGRTEFEYTVSNLPAGSYTFTLSHPSGGSGALVAFDLHQGETVEISGHLDNGIWQVGYITVALHTITVTRHNWGDNQTPLYYGTVTLNTASAAIGERVSFYVKPAEKSSLSELSVTYGNNKQVNFSSRGDMYSFIMPDGDVTINAKFADATVDEVVAPHFKALVYTLYSENPDVTSFGKSNASPDPLIDCLEIRDVKIWYDDAHHKICWYADDGDVLFKPGTMAGFFRGCTKYTSIDMTGLVTTAVNDMAQMFQGCTGLTTLNLSGIDASGAADMSNMFDGCTRLTTVTLPAITNPTNYVNMAGLFHDCTALTTLNNLANFNTSKATSMASMFQGCTSLTTLSLASLKANSATDMSNMFEGCTNLTTLTLTGLTSNTTSGVNMASMFQNCEKLNGLDFSGFNGCSATNLAHIFEGCAVLQNADASSFISRITTSSATSMASMFQDCIGLTSLNLSGFNAGVSRDLSNMFRGCTGLTSLSLEEFTINTTSSVNMAGMFRDCVGLTGTLDLSSFDTTQATDMSYMFCGCRGLTGIDLSGFHTGNVTDMSCMFSSLAEAQEFPPAMNLTSLDVSGFNTAKVTNMRQMFYMCYKLKDDELVVTNFKTKLVTDMSHMFACYNYKSGNDSSLHPGHLTKLDLSGWEFDNVTSTANMFDRQENLSNLIFPSLTNFKSLTTMTFMFSHCLLLTPEKFTPIVSSWKFSGNPNYLTDIYGDVNTSMFGNTENSRTGKNNGANYIFRNSMTDTGKPFATRTGFVTGDGITLYIGGGASEKFGRLTIKPTL